MIRIVDTAFVETLALRDDLSDADQRALDALVGRIRTYSAGEEIVAQGSHPKDSCLMLSGISARAHYLEDGRRQLSAMHIAGDFVDLHSLLLKVMDHSVIALTPCTVAFFAHADLSVAASESPHLARLLWLLTIVDAAVHRAWIVSLGRRTAEAQVAHFFCEAFVRLRAVGLVRNGDSFDLPVRQSDLADMVGLSLVHLNRSVQVLRRRGLLEWKAPTVRLPDFERLSEVAEFDPTYLSLSKQPR